jgi:DNA-binding response OmpR family regulator
METRDTILVVDDQQELREGFSLTLGAAGYHVITAADGITALEYLQNQAIHLIIADIGMPRMNGYQLYERLSAHPQLVRIPFIFLTARGMDSDIRYGKELGVDDYLVKPVEPEDLLATVAGRLRRAARMAQSNSAAIPDLNGRIEQEDLYLGSLHLSPRQRRVWMHEQEIELSAREFDVLEYLIRRPGEVVSLHDLVQISHGLEVDNIEAGSLLRPLMRIIRRKLGYASGELGCIENVRSVGYRIVAP